MEDVREQLKSAVPRPWALVAGAALIAALLAFGCGDDDGSGEGAESGTGPDAVTSTNLDPAGDQTIPDLPVNTDPKRVQCTGPPEGVFDATSVVGSTLARAKEAAAEEGCQIRVAVRDGEPLALTQDYRPDRVNVAVEDGEVTEIIDIG